MPRNGLVTTFAVLQESRNRAVTRALLPALDSPYPGLRQQAFSVLLQQGDTQAYLGLIQRYPMLNAEQKEALRARPSRTLSAIRQAIVSRDVSLCETGCEAALELDQFDLMPTLLSGLESPACPFRPRFLKTFLALVQTVHDRWWKLIESGETDQRTGRELTAIRRRMATALGESVARYDQHRNRDILRAFVLLADAKDAVLLRVLNRPLDAPFAAALEIFGSDPAKNVAYLICELIQSEQAPTAVLTVAGRRRDHAFIHHWLDLIGGQAGPHVARNLKRLRRIEWLHDQEMIDSLTGDRQAAVVRLCGWAAIEPTEAFATIRHLLLEGRVEARREAALALQEFRGAEANGLATEALTDPDPQVQAHIVSQLRDRGIPGSLIRLVEFLDSPHALVRDAARATLPEFRFERFWQAYEQLAPEVRQTTGRLVLIVDPQTPAKLAQELRIPIRARRLQALDMAKTLGIVREVESAIFHLVRVGDRELRTEAILALAQSDSEESLEVVAEACEDESMWARTAARDVIQQRLATRDNPVVVAASNHNQYECI